MKRRAYSLIELIAAQAVLGVCLMGIAALVKAGSRYLLVSNAKSDLQKEAILTLRSIAQQFQETNDDCFTVGNSTLDPNSSTNYGVVFASPRDAKTGAIEYDSAGRLLWCKYVAFYKRNVGPDTCVVRSVARLDPKLPYPPPADPIDLFLTKGYPMSVVSRHVTKFECTKENSNLTMVLRIDLPSNYGKNYGFEMETEVFARN
ncbi:hypothetical protein JST97_16200 [bacterium]|nr:hypothetical protein [bacterium]